MWARIPSKGLLSASARSTNIRWDKGIPRLSPYKFSQMPLIPLAGDRQVSLHLHTPKTVTRLTEQGMVSFGPTRVGDSPLRVSSPGKSYLPFSRNTVSRKSHLVWRFLKIYFDIMNRTFLHIKLMWHGLWNHKDEGLWSDSLLKALIPGRVCRWSFPGRSVLGIMCAKCLHGHSQCSVCNGNKRYNAGTVCFSPWSK